LTGIDLLQVQKFVEKHQFIRAKQATIRLSAGKSAIIVDDSFSSTDHRLPVWPWAVGHGQSATCADQQNEVLHFQ